MSEKTIKSQSQQRFPNNNYREGLDRMNTCTFCIYCNIKSNVFPCSECLEDFKNKKELTYFQRDEYIGVDNGNNS